MTSPQETELRNQAQALNNEYSEIERAISDYQARALDFYEKTAKYLQEQNISILGIQEIDFGQLCRLLEHGKVDNVWSLHEEKTLNRLVELGIATRRTINPTLADYQLVPEKAADLSLITQKAQELRVKVSSLSVSNSFDL